MRRGRFRPPLRRGSLRNPRREDCGRCVPRRFDAATARTARRARIAAETSVPAATATAYGYVATPIPPPAGRTRTRAYGINSQGEVAARAANYSDADQKEIDRQAFVWDPVNGSRPLPTLSGESGVWGLNDDGIVSGYSYNDNTVPLQHAVRWDTTTEPFTLTEIGTLANATTGARGDTSTAYDLSEPGRIAGYSDIPNDDGTFVPFHAILFDDTSGLLDLGTFDTSFPEFQHGYSISYDVNSPGQVVGLASSTEGGNWHFLPFVSDATGTLHELARDPAYSGSQEWYAVAINDSGLIGGHVIAAPNQSFPYYWPDEAAQPVPVTLPSAYPYGEIYGMNAQGQMVGILWNDAGTEHAFVFDTTQGARDLNDLVDPAGGWVISFARDINDSGQIVGSGTINGLARGFLLTPSSLVMGRISGSVRHKVGDAPLPDVAVRIYDSMGGFATEATTDSQGDYTTDWLSPDDYFAVTSNTLGFPEQLYSNLPCAACDPTTGTPVTVTAGSVAPGVDFKLGPLLPSLAVDDASVTEGNSGTVNASFHVTLSAASPQTVTVLLATANGTARSRTDYTRKLTTLRFLPGETMKAVTIAVKGDTRDEADETFFVNLRTPRKATIADGQGVGTILDDDPQP